MNSKRVALAFAATMTMCMIAVPSQGQRPARAPDLGKAVITIDPRDLEVRALRPDGGRAQTHEGCIDGAPLVSECFNGFADGAVSGQFGWTTFTVNLLIPQIESTSPIEGARGVNLPANPAVLPPSNNGIFSPNMGVQPDGQYTGTAKLLIPVTAVTGAQYTVAFQAPSIVNPPPNPPGLITSRILFFPVDIGPQAGVVPDADSEPFDILVLDDPDNAGPTPLAFFATGFEYVPGQVNDLRVEFDSAANTQQSFINNTLIYTGTVYAGTRMEQAVVLSNNFQAPGEIGKTDCIAFEPGLPGADCPGDADGDNDVDADDLVAVVLQWGGVCPCTGDVDADNDVDTDDLVIVVLNWGPC